jgi:protein required for attachment to host cells
MAKLYANTGPKTGLRLVRELDHPASREKASELVTDRPGHNKSSGNGHGAFVPGTDPKEIEAEHFAIEVARHLEDAYKRNDFSRLIITAAPHFLGLLRGRMHNGVRNAISETIEKDYSKISEKELAGHLEKYIYL